MTPREIRKPLANPAGVTSSISREKSGKALEVVSGAGRLVAADVETHRVRHHQANRFGHTKPAPSHRADPIKILANSHPTGRLASGGPQAMNIGSAWRPSDRFSYRPFQNHRFYFILALHPSERATVTNTVTINSALELPPQARVVASGLGFTEGPALLSTGSVAVASVNRGHVYEVPLDGGGVSLLAETGGGPNCVAAGYAGELWVTQNGATAMPSRSRVPAVPSIQRIVDSTVETVSTGLAGPSDCVFGSDGRLWFTDPTHLAGQGSLKPGRLWSLDPATGRMQIHLKGLLFPNGLAFGVDPAQLYVAETAQGRVRRYRVDGDRCEPDGWEVAMPGERPDGLAVDSAGWLWVAGGTGDNVVAFDTDGTVRETLHFGNNVLVTSACFAGPDLNTLVVTIAKGGTVAALPARHRGLPVSAQ